jgi:hypothetical protein
LKDALLEAFKSAANIRNLKPDDTVSVCVVGVPGPAIYKAISIGSTWGKPVNVSTGRGVLAIRVKKSDVDAFAKGKLDLDQFRKRAGIAINAGSSPVPALGRMN